MEVNCYVYNWFEAESSLQHRTTLQWKRGPYEQDDLYLIGEGVLILWVGD